VNPAREGAAISPATRKCADCIGEFIDLAKHAPIARVT
jgi:hypothetical protein